MPTHTSYYSSNLGFVRIREEAGDIVSVSFVRTRSDRPAIKNPVLKRCIREVNAYFDSKRKHFSSTFRLRGTTFQKKVWGELLKIPYGKTVSYQTIAERIGHPKATRAVGNAIGANPVPILVPCHRVIASNGKLGGYSSGLHRKQWLLEHEGARRVKKGLASFYSLSSL